MKLAKRKVQRKSESAISTSKIVFVELAGERPNVYYEAGYAQARGKDMIFAERAGAKVRFDLRGYRMISWHTESDLRRKLRLRLESLKSRDDD